MSTTSDRGNGRSYVADLTAPATSRSERGGETSRNDVVARSLRPWSRALLVRAKPNALPLVALFAIVALILGLHSGSVVTDTKLPIVYQGDGLFQGMIIRQIMEDGWFPALNDRLGAPFGSNLSDYPMSEAANVMLVKLLALFSDNWVVVFNAFYIVGFFAIALTSYLTLTELGIDALWAVTAAVLFTFLPYHYMRDLQLYLASYFAVPIGVWLSYRAAQSKRSTRLQWVTILLASIVAGSAGVYYAFFTCALICVAGFCAGMRERSWRALTPGVAIVLIISVTVALNTLPQMWFKWKNGPNLEVATRSYSNAEIYALKPIQLVLPRPHHRYSLASRTTDEYSRIAPNVNENRTSALGIVGTIGFLFLLTWAFRRLTSSQPSHFIFDHLAAMNLAALMLATVGGVGAVFAFFVSAQIRGYNRISVFIAFLGIAASAILLQRCTSRNENQRTVWNTWPLPLAALVLAIGIWDQTSADDLSSYRGAFDSDRAFVRSIEDSVTPGAKIFQFPVLSYPESPPIFGMNDYDPGRAYLHSSSLKWSYGAVRGRPGGRWLSWVSTLSVDEQISELIKRGFVGIYVDRRGYEDGAKSLELELTRRLGVPKLVSGDGRFAFYLITSSQHRSDIAPPHFSAANTLVQFNREFLPPWIVSISGLSGVEAWGRWTDGAVTDIKFDQPLPRNFKVLFKIKWALGRNVGTPVKVKVGAETQEFVITGPDQEFELRFANQTDADEISLRVPAPVSPRSLGMSDDNRMLGVALFSMGIY